MRDSSLRSEWHVNAQSSLPLSSHYRMAIFAAGFVNERRPGMAAYTKGALRYNLVWRTSSCRRRIQCNSPSRPIPDPTKTIVLNTKTLIFTPR